MTTTATIPDFNPAAMMTALARCLLAFLVPTDCLRSLEIRPPFQRAFRQYVGNPEAICPLYDKVRQQPDGSYVSCVHPLLHWVRGASFPATLLNNWLFLRLSLLAYSIHTEGILKLWRSHTEGMFDLVPGFSVSSVFSLFPFYCFLCFPSFVPPLSVTLPHKRTMLDRSFPNVI